LNHPSAPNYDHTFETVSQLIFLVEYGLWKIMSSPSKKLSVFLDFGSFLCLELFDFWMALVLNIVFNNDSKRNIRQIKLFGHFMYRLVPFFSKTLTHLPYHLLSSHGAFSSWDESNVHNEVLQHPKYANIFYLFYVVSKLKHVLRAYTIIFFAGKPVLREHRCLNARKKKELRKNLVLCFSFYFEKERQLIPLTLCVLLFWKHDKILMINQIGKFQVFLYILGHVGTHRQWLQMQKLYTLETKTRKMSIILIFSGARNIFLNQGHFWSQ
jgi:hypothetical protein